MTVLDKTRQVLDEGPICDSCLGRRFGLLSYGLTSRERGHALRVTLSLEDDTDFEGEPDDCWVCDGFFDEESLERWAERVVESLEGYGFETYQVGTRVPPLVEENENLLDDLVGDEHAQGFSTDFNREVGKRVGELLKEERSNAPEVGFDRPDVVAVVDLTEEAVDLQVNPLHVYGRYRKLERDVPQTEWPCRDCDGTGEKGGEECDHCGGTGYMYEVSVEELIRPAVLDAFGGDRMVFHGAGREDVDALMLGDGRPFVAEVKEPRKRMYDLERLASEVNESAEGKVEVGELKLVSPDMVERVKQLDASKRYRMTVELSKEVSGEELEDALCSVEGEVEQRTPRRVSHRRSDRVRRREVHEATGEPIDGPGSEVEIEIHGEGGLYVKELVSGDDGRTEPNLADELGDGVEAEVKKLDVLEVEGDFLKDEFVKNGE